MSTFMHVYIYIYCNLCCDYKLMQKKTCMVSIIIVKMFLPVHSYSYMHHKDDDIMIHATLGQVLS